MFEECSIAQEQEKAECDKKPIQFQSHLMLNNLERSEAQERMERRAKLAAQAKKI